MFCYLGDALCTEDGIQETVTTRIRARLKRFKNVVGVLYQKLY